METSLNKLPDSGNLISVCARIVENKQYEYFMDKDGNKIIIDLFSAGVILTVYNALNENNKKKFLNLHPLRAQEMALKLLKRKE